MNKHLQFDKDGVEIPPEQRKFVILDDSNIPEVENLLCEYFYGTLAKKGK